MRIGLIFATCFLTAAAGLAHAGDATFTVSDPGGIAAKLGAPVSVRVDLDQIARDTPVARLRLVELEQSGKTGATVPVQFEPDQTRSAAASGGSRQGTLWWLMPPGPAGQRRFRLTAGDADAPQSVEVAPKDNGRCYDVLEAARPVLRYSHGTVPVPPGTDPKYARGDYIHPVFGLSGELLSDDYPRDHPHHRGVGWSWPVTRWNNEVRDIWAVVGVWSRPDGACRTSGGPVVATVEARNVWKWGDKDPIVREEVLIRPFKQGAAGRFVDVEVRLSGLADGVAIGGRPHAGYGGFGLRGAPAKDRKITAFVDPAGASPRRSWLDYSGVMAGGKGPSGVAILEHPANPGYPSDLHQYPDCNYVMPAFPGQREVSLPKGQTLVLRHRLWIHDGVPDAAALASVWNAYAEPPTVTITR